MRGIYNRLKKRIHINQHIIRSNQTRNETKPPIRIKTGGRNIKAHSVSVMGPCAVIYRPNRPLSCGARVWIETNSDVAYDSEEKL